MTTDLEIYEARPATPSSTLFGTNDPGEVVAVAAAAAKPLADVVEQQKLFTNIGGKKHVRVEGWSLLGSMLGVFAVLDGDVEPVTIGDVPGWRATMKAVTRDGSVVGRATAYCMSDEKNWRNRDDYALISMAQTRATSKALRQPLGFVMTLAGFDATPAEEMPTVEATPVPFEPAEDKPQHPNQPLVNELKLQLAAIGVNHDDLIEQHKGDKKWLERQIKAAKQNREVAESSQSSAFKIPEGAKDAPQAA